MTYVAVAIAGGVAVAGQVASYDQQRKAAKQNKKAQQKQDRLQNIQAARERRQQIRAAQKAQAELAFGAQVSGTAATSSVAVGSGSVQTQLASNISFLDQAQQLNKETSIFLQKAADYTTRAAGYQTLSNVSLQGASLFAGPK